MSAHKIGALLFCPKCGTLLDLPRDGEMVVICEQCQHEEPSGSFENTVVTTRSHPDAFPSPLQQKRKTLTKKHDKGDEGTLVSEKCPACGNMEAFSKERQMRSADEGSTVFYSCTSCKHAWRVNN